MKERWVQEILKRWGQRVTLCRADGSEEESRAFLQPVSQQKEAEPFLMTELGSVDDRLWLYLGTVPLEAGEHLLRGERCFRVRSCRPYEMGERPLYWWAMLEGEREAAVR